MAEDADGKNKYANSSAVPSAQHSVPTLLDEGLTTDPADVISPLLLGKQKDCDEFHLDGSSHVSSKGKTGKHHRPKWLPHHRTVQSPRASPALSATTPNSTRPSVQPPQDPSTDDEHHTRAIVAQAWEWLHVEKQKRRLRRHKPKKSRDDLDAISEDAKSPGAGKEKSRRDSSGSDTSGALDELEDILRRDSTLSAMHRKSSTRSARRRPGMGRRSTTSLRPRKLSATGASSDTDVADKEISVSTCETWLDNTRTLSRNAGLAAIDESGESCSKTMSPRDRDAWADFQRDILRIAHTLQLKRWRRVPLERSNEIVVQRLSGALTNAVYTVSPPADLSSHEGRPSIVEGGEPHNLAPRARPNKLLLRIYGPQVEHLIDRDAELQILRRLGRQNIGPRLLGTFNNGRFEEYLHAKPLSPQDLRQSDVSRQIAKRMRELHDGIELTKNEREAGPFVWRNWDKWLDRCARIVTYIDGQVQNEGPASPVISRLRKRSYVCGTTWEVFKSTVEKFRTELTGLYGGPEQVKRDLVFAHNDTQYGNILRQEPPGESPLLLPANVHKQLVVIDFEYANANTAGLEFANHFTEWCYNYHHPELSFECQTSYYPTLEEQGRFIQAYLQHQPQFTPAASTPRMRPGGSVSSISGITAGARTPSLTPLERERSDSSSTKSSYFEGVVSQPTLNSMSSLNLDRAESNHADKEASRKADLEAQVHDLIQETRLWRIANSAQWVAWGIVQARIPGLNSQPHSKVVKDTATDWPKHAAANAGEEGVEGDEEEDVEFDYLSYARSRAMFFWGDCVQFGLIKKEDLPQDVQKHLKIVTC